MQSGQLIPGSLRQYFHAAVVIVADPSGDTENVRLAFDEPTEADALDTAANHKAPRKDRFFGGSHCLQLSSRVEKQIRESEAASLSKDPCNLNFSSSLMKFQPVQPQENVFLHDTLLLTG